MFNIINRYKKQQKRKQLRKVLFFSTISAGIAAVSALFLNNKENRDKIVNTAKEVADKTKVESQKAYNQASGRISEFSGKASEAGSKFYDTIRNKFQKASDKVEDKANEVKDAVNNEFDGIEGNDRIK